MLTFFRNLLLGQSVVSPEARDELMLETRLPFWLEMSPEPVDERDYQKRLAKWDALHREVLNRGWHGTIARPVAASRSSLLVSD